MELLQMMLGLVTIGWMPRERPEQKSHCG